MTEETKKYERPRYRDANRIVMTPEMVEAGVTVAWMAPEPPQIVEDQVRKIYLAMELEKYRQVAG